MVFCLFHSRHFCVEACSGVSSSGVCAIEMVYSKTAHCSVREVALGSLSWVLAIHPNERVLTVLSIRVVWPGTRSSPSLSLERKRGKVSWSWSLAGAPPGPKPTVTVLSQCDLRPVAHQLWVLVSIATKMLIIMNTVGMVSYHGGNYWSRTTSSVS